MTPVTRWKTIATIAVAFSAGNLFATACQDGKSAQADESADDDGGSSGEEGSGDGDTDGDDPPPPEVSEADIAELSAQIVELSSELSSLQREVEDHACYFEHITDYDNTGSSVDREDHVSAVSDCRI